MAIARQVGLLHEVSDEIFGLVSRIWVMLMSKIVWLTKTGGLPVDWGGNVRMAHNSSPLLPNPPLQGEGGLDFYKFRISLNLTPVGGAGCDSVGKA